MSTTKTIKSTKPKARVTVGRARLMSTKSVQLTLINDIMTGLYRTKLEKLEKEATALVKGIVDTHFKDFFDAYQDKKNPLSKYVGVHTNTFKYKVKEGTGDESKTHAIRVPRLILADGRVHGNSNPSLNYDSDRSTYYGSLFGTLINATVPAKAGQYEGIMPVLSTESEEYKKIQELDQRSEAMKEEFKEVCAMVTAAISSYKTVPEFYDAYPKFAKLTKLPAYHPKPAGTDLAILPDVVETKIEELGLPEPVV